MRGSYTQRIRGTRSLPSAPSRGRWRRRAPYIFSPEEIRALLEAAATLDPRNSLRPRAYVTLFGLIAATGLRISEALRVAARRRHPFRVGDPRDKLKKSRLVPLHPTTRVALDAYLRARAKHAVDDDAVLLSDWRTRMSYPTVLASSATSVANPARRCIRDVNRDIARNRSVNVAPPAAMMAAGTSDNAGAARGFVVVGNFFLHG